MFLKKITLPPFYQIDLAEKRNLCPQSSQGLSQTDSTSQAAPKTQATLGQILALPYTNVDEKGLGQEGLDVLRNETFGADFLTTFEQDDYVKVKIKCVRW